MQDSPFKKLLLLLMLLALGAALVLQFLNSKFMPAAPKSSLSAKVSRPEPAYHYTPPGLPPTKAQTGSAAVDDAGDNPFQIPRGKAEAWLAKHNRNAASLLAVFRALGDTNYLNEAATNFPNNPQVELAVLAHNAFPEDRRKWLDLFKASSPSNSLANYFSAQEYFANGSPDEAVKELLAASGKSQFDSHGMETQLDAEELYLDSGKSPREAATLALSAMATDALPELATIKQVDQGIADLMKQKMDAGDTGSAINLAQIGTIIADKLNSGDSGKYLINQLVGLATEAIMLSHLDQNTAYDFLGGQTPAQVLQANKQQKTALRELWANFKTVYPTLTDAELNNYVQRSRIYGEAAAKEWGIQQHPPATPPQ